MADLAVVEELAQLRALYIGGYWRGATDMVRMIQHGLSRTGVLVRVFDTDAHPQALDTDGLPYDRGTSGPVWLRWVQLGKELEEHDPHLVICNAGGLSFRPDDAARVRRRCCLLGIALSDPDVFEPSTRHIAANFDCFLTNTPVCVPWYQALGARSGVLPAATSEEVFRPLPAQPEHECEVLVLARAHPDRVEPVKAMFEQFDTHIYGEGWDAHGLPSRGLLAGDDVITALCSARVVPVFNRTRSGQAVIKVGLFDFLAAGAFVLTNYFDEVEQYFVFDREIAGFGSTPDLLHKIRYYLDHPDRAEAIRSAGRRRVLEEHTWPHVWLRILQQLQAGGQPAGASGGRLE
jgi:hypothetical protein